MIFILVVLLYLVVGTLIIIMFNKVGFTSMGYDPSIGEYVMSVVFWPIVIIWVILKAFGWLARLGSEGKKKKN